MFWDSLIAGLEMLTYWETYVAVLEYLAILFVPMIVIGMAMEKDRNAGASTGCLMILLMPLSHIVALVVMLLTLAPIIFGFSEDAAWGFPLRLIIIAPGSFFTLVGVLVVAAIILPFIPILGQILAQSPSSQTFIFGCIALIFILEIFDSMTAGVFKANYIPGFWFSIGLIVIGGIMSLVGMMVAILTIAHFKVAEKGFGQIVMFPLVTIFELIPVFMYGAWLGAQVRGGF